MASARANITYTPHGAVPLKLNESSTDFCGRWHSELANVAYADSMSGHVRFLRIHLSSRAAFAQSVSQSVLPGTLTWPA